MEGRNGGKKGRKFIHWSSNCCVYDPSPLDMGIHYYVSHDKSLKRIFQDRKILIVVDKNLNSSINYLRELF